MTDPLAVWQQIYPGTLTPGVQPCGTAFAASLPDGRQILLPIRTLPGGQERGGQERGGQERGVASLIVNQASFDVLDALAAAVVALLPDAPSVVVGVPTLGLPLAEAVARRLGHARMVPLSTSRKFWYDAALAEPMTSITSPGQVKHLYIDPRLLPLLTGRVLLVDDVLSTGASIAATLRLLARAGVRPDAIACAMLQGTRWQAATETEAPGTPVLGAIRTPLLERAGADATWQEMR